MSTLSSSVVDAEAVEMSMTQPSFSISAGGGEEGRLFFSGP